MRHRNGFTLAETLITLVIIGIVAALTVPGLIAKYQRQELKSRFKQSISLVYQVFDKIKANEGVEVYNNYAPYSASFFILYLENIYKGKIAIMLIGQILGIHIKL